MTDVWTAQAHTGDDAPGWMLGGVFSTLRRACEYAEEWASDKPGAEVYVYRRVVDSPLAPVADHVPVFKAPPGTTKATAK